MIIKTITEAVYGINIMTKVNTMKLIHSFVVNIRICQPESSDVHRGKGEVKITFES